MLAFAFPDRVARNRGNGSFVLANGRGAAVEQTSSLARAPYIAVAELTGTGGQRAHPAGGADRAGRNRSSVSPIRSKAATKFRSIAARWRLRARRRRALHAITLSEAPMALSPSAETAQDLRRRLDRRRTRQIAVVEIARSNGATASCSCARRKARAGPICPIAALAAASETGWCLRSTTRPR